MFKQKLGVAAMAGFLLLSSSLAAKDFYGGIKLGMLSGGTLTVSDWGGPDFDVDNNAALTYGFYGDYKVAEKMSMGAHLDFWTFSPDVAGVDSETMMDIGADLKAWIFLEGTSLVIKPGFGIGYGSLDLAAPIDDGKFFLVRGFAECVYQKKDSKVGFLGELGILAAPSGGNDLATVTFGPILYLKGGVVF